MAVSGFPRRQEDPLIQQLLERARQQARLANQIGSPSMYTAEAYGGNFPIGTLTAQVLGGVRAGVAEREAQKRQEMSDKASNLLASIEPNSQFDYNNRKIYTDDKGNFLERAPLAEILKGPPEMVDRPEGGGKEAASLEDLAKLSMLGGSTTLAADVAKDPLLEKKIKTSIRIGPDDDPNVLERIFLGKALKGKDISKESDLITLAGYDRKEYDLYKRKKQGALTPVTLFKGNRPFQVLMKTDEAGSFVNYQDFKGNIITDLTGLSTSKSVKSRRDKFMEDYVADFTIKSNIAGRNYDIEEVVRTANRLADELNMPKDNISTTQNDISIIEDDLGSDDIMGSLNGESKTDKQKDKDTDDTLVKPRLSEEERAIIAKNREEAQEKKRKNIQFISSDVGSLDLTRSKITTLQDALPKIEKLYEELERLNITGRAISANALISTSGPAAQLIGLIDTLKGSVFVSATSKLKEAGGGSTGMGQLTEVEGEKIQGSEGQVKVDLKDQTINTLKKVLKELQQAESRKLKLLNQLYGEEYKKFMAN